MSIAHNVAKCSLHIHTWHLLESEVYIVMGTLHCVSFGAELIKLEVTLTAGCGSEGQQPCRSLHCGT